MAKAKQHLDPHQYKYNVRQFMLAIVSSMVRQATRTLSIDLVADLGALQSSVADLPGRRGEKKLICSQSFQKTYSSQSLQAKVYAMRRTLLASQTDTIEYFFQGQMEFPYWLTGSHIKFFLEQFILKSIEDKPNSHSLLECTWKQDSADGTPFAFTVADPIYIPGEEAKDKPAPSGAQSQARIDGYDPRGPYASRGGAIAIAQKQGPLSEEDRIAALNDELGNAINEKLNANPKKQTAHSFLLSSQESKEDMVEAARAQIAAAKASGLLR